MLGTPGDSVALARSAIARLRSAAVVGSSSSTVLEALAASPLDYACDAQDGEATLCDEFLAESAHYGVAIVSLLEMLDTFAADGAVGVAFLADPTKVKHFLWLPPGGIAQNALIGHEERPASGEGPLTYRLNGTDAAIAASSVGLLSARMAEHMFQARAVENSPSVATTRAMGILLGRYAMLVSTP